ncbi:tyrosine-type recombinase/integrase [Pacificoceanicola onchidii]|uniref:tyrosine-type recombinase/integrase n=1 Tax=Pacificoceanicola onchidii TaxID=2562685 RepID=UPI0010A33132|nr:tyrosine-type recombinase/integrase [Pacificoceanicola onchidii]
MRPPKPRITKPKLVWKLNRQKTAWVPYHRVRWTVNGKRKEKAIMLDWKGDARLLDELYWSCESGRHEGQKRKPKHTWRECIEAWRKDPKGQGRLARSTRASYRRAMDRINVKNGDKSMGQTTPKNLYQAHLAMSATPREADRMLQTVSLLWNYAKSKLFWPIGDNPASGIEHFGKQREFEPWPAWMVGKLDEAPETVRTAAKLILGTGQRPGAAIQMRRDAFEGEYMTVTDEKGGQKFEVYAPDFLRSYVASLPHRGDYLLARNIKQPLGYDAVEKAFRAWRKDLGVKAKPFVLHGLRKLAIIELAESGATDAQIQAVTGQSAEMVAFYRAKASRKALSRAAQKGRE